VALLQTPSAEPLECILIDADDLMSEIPDLEDLTHQWAASALVHTKPDLCYSVNFQFMLSDDIQALNHQFRGKDKPTNVLTFASNTPFDPLDEFLGDIAVCMDILKEEATSEKKSLKDHLAHLIIHSILHCQGFDHETDEQALEMESLEINLLAQFGIKNPYEVSKMYG
jgi:probable rRNA maturation factor